VHAPPPTALGRCRVCATELAGPILDLGAQPVADALIDPDAPAGAEPSFPLVLAVCPACSLVQLARMEAPAGATHGHGTAYSTTMTAHVDDWATELIRDDLVSPGGLVIDVAAGSGHLLRPFRRAGFRVAGLEADAALATTSRDAGLDVRPGRLGSRAAGELVAAVGSADLVIVNHAFAHIDDLADAMAGLAALLGPGGSVAIEFHHVLGLTTENQFDIVCHAHRSYLSLGALRFALERAGLELVRARRMAVHGGAIRALAARPDRAVTLRAAGDDRETARIDELERAAGLDRPEGYAGMAAAAASVCADLVAALRGAAGDGLTVAGYGAPTRAATLLNTAGITAADLPFTVDRAPEKQGRCLPGSRVRILAPDAFDERRPDRVLILVWPLRDEIVQQLGSLRARGTRFIVPLPTLEVLG